MWPFSRTRIPSSPPRPPIELVESLSGNWFYHLARTTEDAAPRTALCGSTHIMSSPGLLSHWGYRGHLRERYCVACEQAARGAGWGALLGAPVSRVGGTCVPA